MSQVCTYVYIPSRTRTLSRESVKRMRFEEVFLSSPVFVVRSIVKSSKMTPPLSWHFLQDKNGRIQVIKSGKELDNRYVTSVQCCAKGDKTVLRVGF